MACAIGVRQKEKPLVGIEPGGDPLLPRFKVRVVRAEEAVERIELLHFLPRGAQERGEDRAEQRQRGGETEGGPPCGWRGFPFQASRRHSQRVIDIGRAWARRSISSPCARSLAAWFPASGRVARSIKRWRASSIGPDLAGSLPGANLALQGTADPQLPDKGTSDPWLHHVREISQ